MASIVMRVTVKVDGKIVGAFPIERTREILAANSPEIQVFYDRLSTEKTIVGGVRNYVNYIDGEGPIAGLWQPTSGTMRLGLDTSIDNGADDVLVFQHGVVGYLNADTNSADIRVAGEDEEIDVLGFVAGESVV